MKVFLKHVISLFYDIGNQTKLYDKDKSDSNIEPEKSIIPAINEVSKYRPQKTRNLYNPLSLKPFKISRSKLELFLRCPRCFYLDIKLGIRQPPGYPFSLNNAVDELLKKEFDTFREEQKPHPLCLENNINLIPFKHGDIDKWRNSLHAGVQYIIPNTNIMIYGGLDDIWTDPISNEIFVVDYKATSKTGIISLDADWQLSYKRQVEIYQWLLRKNDFSVSNTAYFVYCNGKRDLPQFDKKLHFDVFLLPYNGNDSWVEEVINEAYKCIQSNVIPHAEETCDNCQYLKCVQNRLKDV